MIKHNNNKKQEGFTLIEAMISLFILSFALLGLAATQINSMQSTNSSYKLTIANIASKDAFSLMQREFKENGIACSQLPSVIESDWLNRWRGVIPNISGAISENTSVSDDCLIVVEMEWNDPRMEGGIRYMDYRFIIS
jgi:prepilin-type N-terminal cleavage/methylation domain-containing protein